MTNGSMQGMKDSKQQGEENILKGSPKKFNFDINFG